METKISMKTIYLILVITIGLVGLGVGSTFAVFTASAEITNPISFSSNLTYNGDIFDTTEVTIGPNSYTFSNISIYNEEQLEGIKYTTWYIYDGSASDLTFEETQDGDTTPSGNDISGGGTVGLKITNNTSNTITITIGVTTSRDDIVLPSYMKPITFSTATKYTLTITKGTGVGAIYYKTGSATSYTRSSSSVSISLEKGTAYSYYGLSQIGYTLSSCNGLNNVCTGTMGTSAVTKNLSASKQTYTISYNANGGTGAPAAQTKTYDVALTLSNTKPVKIGYPFLGWATNSSGTGTIYQPGGSFTTNANTTLYAKYSTTQTSYTVKLNVDAGGYEDTSTILAGDEFKITNISIYQQSIVSEECTNGQTIVCSVQGNNYMATCTIASVTADTECTVFSNEQLMG